jgi:hypothetical protein
MADQETARRTRSRPTDDVLLAEMRRRFSYNAVAGCFVWKAPLRNITKKPGDAVGGQKSQRYSGVYLLGHRFKVHRLIWLWHHESYPVGDIDHINGNTADNRIENLRLATPAQNIANRVRASKHGTGVDAAPDGKFAARITLPITKKRLYLGRFSTPAEAAAAFIGASVVLHGAFSAAISRDTHVLNRGGRGVQSPLDRIITC